VSTDEITEWMRDHPAYDYTEIPPEDNLFGENLEMYADKEEIDQGIYNGFDENGNKIFIHQEFPDFDAYKELQPEQARALEDQYGSAKLVVMEQADTDGDGALDTVAVRYEGSKDVLEFEMDYNAGWRGVSTYIYAKLIGV
jgi:hypothetical protein